MLTILQGRARSGKTHRILEAVCQSVKNGRQAVLIVPDQETFLYERRLCEALGGGFLQAEVISFNRLCMKIVRQSGRGGAVHLSDQGRAMLMKSAILSCRDELTVFRRTALHTGFGEKMLRMAALMKSCAVSPDVLRALAQSRPEGILRRKLEDSCLIFERYQALLSQGYADNNDLFEMACTALNEPGVMADTDFYIDGFDLFTVMMQRLMLALLRTHGVTVALSASMGGGDARLYALQEEAAARLRALCRDHGLPFTVESLPARPLPTAALQRIADGFGKFTAACKTPSGVPLFIGQSPEAEVRNAAAAILSGVREEGLRYRDFCVVCNAPEEYFPIIDRVFRLFGIPAFADVRRPVLSLPPVRLILSAVRACCAPGGLAPVPCTEYLANILCPGPRPEAEELRELIDLLGLFPGELLNGTLVRGTPEQRARFAELHTRFLLPLCLLRNRLGTACEVGDFTRAISDFIVENNLADVQQSYLEQLEAEGLLTLADESRSAWTLAQELLDQMAGLLGAARLPLPELCAVLEEGFAQATAGVLPTTADCVLLGDLSRSKSGKVRRLIVLGMNEGVLPAPLGGEGLLSPVETDLLNAEGAGLKPDTETLFRQQNYDIYSALLQTQESLCFSCSAAAANGEELQPSSLLTVLERILGPLEKIHDTPALARAQWLLCPDGAAPLLGRSLRAARQGIPFPAELTGYLAYLHHTGAPVLRMQKQALAQTTPALRLQNAQALFAQAGTVSISRLETQAECPFKHFVQYGLSPEEQDLFEGNAADIGSLLHEVMERFLVDRMHAGMEPLSLQQVFDLADQQFDAALPKQHFGALAASARARQLARHLRSVARISALELTRQLSPAGFMPLAQEARFGDGRAIPAPAVESPHGTLRLKGVIDRIDALQTPEACYLRVIDYKSSDHKFSLGAVADGTQLQLPLYLQTAMGLRTDAVPAGAYYLTLGFIGADQHAARFGVSLDDPAVTEALHREGAPKGTLSREDMAALIELSLRRARELTDDILTGKIEPSPLGRACEYCRYRRICAQDDAMGPRRRAGCKKVSLKQEADHGMDE